MSTLVKVARYHLVQPVLYLAIAWGVLAFGFAVNVIIFATNPATATDPDPRYTGALSSFFTLCFVRGWYTIGKSLPFGLTLGVSRRAYYLGTALLAVVLACADGLALTGLQAIERATGGWGVDMGFFRVPYLLGGPWYLTWLTLFAGLTLVFVYGMWFGIVHRRWSLVGTIGFIAAQVTVLLAAGLGVTWAHGWASVGHFFTSLTAAGLTGLFAALAVVLLAGGHATIRRATV